MDINETGNISKALPKSKAVEVVLQNMEHPCQLTKQPHV